MATEEKEVQEPEVTDPPAEAPEKEAAGEKKETPGEKGGEEQPEGGEKAEEKKTFDQDQVNHILNQDKKGYRRENADLREEVARLKGVEEGRKEVAPEPTPESIGPPVEPKEDDFGSWDEYRVALKEYDEELFDYRYEKRAGKEKEANATKTATDKEAERVTTATENFAKKAEEFKSSTPDFDEVVENAPGVSETMFITIRDQAMPEVSYHLAKNPEEIARIGKLTPPEQVIELGRIAGRLEAKGVTTATGKTISNAPAPPTPVRGRGGTAGKDPYKMDAKETYEYEKNKVAKTAAKK